MVGVQQKSYYCTGCTLFSFAKEESPPPCFFFTHRRWLHAILLSAIFLTIYVSLSQSSRFVDIYHNTLQLNMNFLGDSKTKNCTWSWRLLMTSQSAVMTFLPCGQILSQWCKHTFWAAFGLVWLWLRSNRNSSQNRSTARARESHKEAWYSISPMINKNWYFSVKHS